MAGQIAVVVFTAAGDDHHLPGTLLFDAGHSGQRCAAAAQNHRFFPGKGDARPLCHPAEAGGVGVESVQFPVGPAGQGVDAADGLGHGIDHVAEGHHVPLVGDGDIQPTDVWLTEKALQFVRFQLNQPVALAA